MTGLAIPSFGSMLIRLTRRNLETGEDVEVTTGTGFAVTYQGCTYLITNWHVISGMNPITGELLGRYVPDTVLVDFHSDDIHNASTHQYPLYEDGRPLWLVDPARGKLIDVVALKIAIGGSFAMFPERVTRLEPYPLEPSSTDIRIEPTSEVSVIGYPFGQRSAGTLGIWSRGAIASEPTLDFANDPAFLIDCRSRPGQSGSPVIAYRPANTLVPQTGGHTVMRGGSSWTLLGVYSGRINNESDLGRVWRRQTTIDVIEGDTRDTFSHI